MSLVKLISEKKSLFTNVLNRKDLASIDVEILDKSEVVKMPEVKYITLESKYITFIQLGSRIQSIQSRFKSIEFDDNRRVQADKLINIENIMTFIVNILIDQINNFFSFKNNVNDT